MMDFLRRLFRKKPLFVKFMYVLAIAVFLYLTISYVLIFADHLVGYGIESVVYAVFMAGFYFNLTLFSLFITVCFAAFWTWVVDKICHIRVLPRTIPEGSGDCITKPLIGLTVYVWVYFAFMVGGFGFLFVRFADITFTDQLSGPLVFFLVGPFALGVGITVCVCTAVFAVLTPVCYLFGRIMMRYMLRDRVR